MRLKYASLTAFMEIIRCGSFEEAARRLYITSSAVSQRVRQLESQLGQVLIVRGSPCRPTEVGQSLFRHAEQMDLLENELFSMLDMPARQRIAVAVNADSIDGWFLDAMQAASQHAGLLLDVRVEDQAHSAALLRAGQVMAAVSASPEPIQGCSVRDVGTMRYLAFCAPSFRQRYFSDGVNADSLQRAPALVFNAKDGLQTQFIASVTDAACEPPQQFIPSTAAYVEAVARGLGWGMLPEFMAQPQRASGKLVALAPERPCDVRLYWHRWNIESASLETLSQCVLSAGKQHLLS